MQPLVSPVDHESRHNSYRADDDEPGPSEGTPLIRRFPPGGPPPRGPVTTAVVSVLLLVLVSGVIIGIYLLIVQNSEENILPPVEAPLMLVSRVQWDNETHALLGLTGARAKQLVAVQTDTRECATKRTCIALLKQMQQSQGHELPYNFLVSSSGQVFEAMGWQLSPQFPQYRALVLAFIGNFTESPPSRAQMKGAEHFFGFSVSQQHLVPSFVILCNDTKYSPKYLHQSLQRYPQWGSASLYV